MVMGHEDPSTSAGYGGDDPALRALRETLNSVSPEAAVFEDAIQQRLTEQPIEPGIYSHQGYDQYPAERAQALLSEHGFSYPPQAVPRARKLEALQENDWAEIQASKTPLLSLWSRANAKEVAAHYQSEVSFAPTQVARAEGRKTPYERQQEDALVKSLPLIHGTSYQALCASFEDGAFVSNRALYEKNIDVTAAGTGATNLYDREVGLDNYVFADYGRPNSSRVSASEVEVVFEPEAMQQDGAFVTEHDLQDFEMHTPTGQTDYRKYMGEAYTPEDFQKVVAPNIKLKKSERVSWGGRNVGEIRHNMTIEDFAGGSDGEIDQLGQAHFSTFEVKIPRVPTEHTRKVIFANPEQYEDFKQRFPNIACEMRAPAPGFVDDPIHEGYKRNMQMYGTAERQQHELERMRSEAYSERVAGLRQAEDVQEGYMILKHPAPYDPDANMYNPNWFAATQKKYSSPEEALDVARRSRSVDPLSALMGEVERPEADMGIVDTAAIAKVTYSGSNNDLTIIQSLRVEPVV